MRILRAVVLALLGSAAAVAAVFEHSRWWGLLLAYAAVVGVTLLIPPGFSTRLPFGTAFGAVLVAAMLPRPEGDFLIAADSAGYLLLALGLIVLFATVSTLPPPRAFSSRRPTTQNGRRDQRIGQQDRT